MAKNIGYITNDDVIKEIDISKCELTNGINVHTRKGIDTFTTSFNNESELIKYLKEQKLIPEDVDKIYLIDTTYLEELGSFINQIEYNGDIILFSRDKVNLDLDKVKEQFYSLKSNPKGLEMFTEMSLKYYGNMKLNPKNYKYATKMCGILETLKTASNFLKDGTYEDKNYRSFNLYKDSFYEFVEEEFYNHKENKKTKKIKKTENYSNIHRFVISKKYIDKEYRLNRRQEFLELNKIQWENKRKEYKALKEKIKQNKEEENYLNLNEIYRDLKRVLENYKEQDFEPYEDGIDYVKPTNKEEIMEDLIHYESNNIKRR